MTAPNPLADLIARIEKLKMVARLIDPEAWWAVDAQQGAETFSLSAAKERVAESLVTARAVIDAILVPAAAGKGE